MLIIGAVTNSEKWDAVGSDRMAATRARHELASAHVSRVDRQWVTAIGKAWVVQWSVVVTGGQT